MAIDVEITRRRFTVDERHAACVARLTEVFVRGLSGRAVVWPQSPVLLEVEGDGVEVYRDPAAGGYGSRRAPSRNPRS